MEERRELGAIELAEGEDKGFRVARLARFRFTATRPEWICLLAGHRNKMELRKLRRLQDEVGRERESMERGRCLYVQKEGKKRIKKS